MSKLPLLNQRQCRVSLKAYREFGYTNLTLEDVCASAERIANGTDSETNVIDVLLKREVEQLAPTP